MFEFVNKIDVTFMKSFNSFYFRLISISNFSKCWCWKDWWCKRITITTVWNTGEDGDIHCNLCYGVIFAFLNHFVQMELINLFLKKIKKKCTAWAQSYQQKNYQNSDKILRIQKIFSDFQNVFLSNYFFCRTKYLPTGQWQWSRQHQTSNPSHQTLIK